jgi:DnaJ-class molecular chaperone
MREDLTPPPQHDYYQILGVARDATAQEIDSAVEKLAAEFHAAGKPANSEAVERFRAIFRAHHVLSDAELPRRYDEFGENGIGDQPFESGLDRDALDKLFPFTKSRGGFLQALLSGDGPLPGNDWLDDFLFNTASIEGDSIDRD